MRVCSSSRRMRLSRDEGRPLEEAKNKTSCANEYPPLEKTMRRVQRWLYMSVGGECVSSWSNRPSLVALLEEGHGLREIEGPVG